MIRLEVGRISLIELLYVCDHDFQEDVQTIRKKYDIQTDEEDIVPVEKYIDFDTALILSDDLKIRYENDISVLSNKYNIEEHRYDVEILVEAGMMPYSDEAFVDERNMYKAAISKPKFKVRDFLDYIPPMGFKVEFDINQPVARKDLKYWFEDNLDEILTAVNDRFVGIKPSVIKVDNLKRILRIIKLKDKYKYTFSHIADTICEENSDDSDVKSGVVNEVSIRQTYNRYKKRYKRDN